MSAERHRIFHLHLTNSSRPIIMLRPRKGVSFGPLVRLCRGSLSAIPLGSRIRPISTVRWNQAIVTPVRPWTSDGTRRAYSSQTDGIKRTPLYDLHVEHGGKMVPFGGYELPVEYPGLSIRDSSIWTREKASMFDVSHM